MDVFNLIYESLQILYVYIPKELVLILGGGLISIIVLTILERDKTNEEKN
tara:strand:+ start:1291 stop:1440 length:150 start_codon:yes stop_codon:yes gene_type:complete